MCKDEAWPRGILRRQRFEGTERRNDALAVLLSGELQPCLGVYAAQDVLFEQ